MKKIFFVILLMGFQFSFAQEAAVRKAIDVFFEGFHEQDTIKMQSVFAKEIVLHSIAEKNDGTTFLVETAVAKLTKSIAAVPKNVKIEERLLSYKIQIDGNMAQAWTPYEFYINGELSHSGVNSFQLYKHNGHWKIVYCIDTRRTP